MGSRRTAITAGLKLASAIAFLGACLCVRPSSAVPPDQPPTKDQVTFFETKIRPILAANCFTCHGAGKQLSGLRLDTKSGFNKGGDSGPAFVAGHPDTSLIIQAIRQTGSLKMPVGGKLTDDQLSDFEAWIKMGAPWPDDSAAPTQTATMWSLQPVAHPLSPKVKNRQWPINSIDKFVLAKLESNKLKPNPPADRRTLIRRVTYDLTGLPPTPDEVDAFLADKSPTAYEKVVDRLLASPRYGERWARHWMDIARYSDTKGYVFNEDRNYPNAYTYRDWLIQSFNRDLPFDQFIVDQLAADRLPEIQSSDDKRPLAALGFLTVGRRFLNTQPDIIDDRIDVTMRGFQGLTVACARCHDHKFDPIPTQDYYSLYAVFASSEEVASPISDKAIRDPWESYNSKLSATDADMQKLTLAQVARLRTPEVAATLDTAQKKALQSLLVGAEPDDREFAKLSVSFEPAVRDKIFADKEEDGTLRQHTPTTPEFAMAMEDRKNPSDGVVFKRGNPNARGEAAPRRFLECMAKPGTEREHWTQDSGRLELAEAIASRENPLTARVFVNRVWQEDFGAGIVRTPSDFGHQGEKPTDPLLLDFLASKFMDTGWSVKKLQRLIVTSAAYRQSSAVTPAQLNADPENRLWGRMNRRRLDLEETRDTILDVAGRLDLHDVGGKSVDLWSQPFTDRRAVYGFIERQNLPGVFHTFDFATPDSTVAKRFVTTVPQQALFFMNSAFTVDAAREVAARSEIEQSSDDAQRIRRLYRILFDRLPDAQESKVGLAYLHSGATISALVPTWKYGLGSFDPVTKRTTSFLPLEHFAEGKYSPSAEYPDPKLGYAALLAQGGHPGHDSLHSVIRRWTAAADATVKISGAITHQASQGDGIHALVVSSRSGLLGEWSVHHGTQRINIESISVQKGETIDFIVEPGPTDSYDSFTWSPKIQTMDGRQLWDASKEFGPPPGPPLTRLALYAQALLMTNEFVFVD
jgi:mono/diheme cytochrome c family protein